MAAPPLPFWGNLFSYHQTNAYQNLGQEKIKVVCNDARGERSDDSGLVERDIVLGIDTLNFKKMPHQGEFDNIHMAPKLKMVHVTHTSLRRCWARLSRGDTREFFPVDPAQLGLDDISMAPFCAHDYFHMHWRWGSGALRDGLADGIRPRPGGWRPLVPLNQGGATFGCEARLAERSPCHRAERTGSGRGAGGQRVASRHVLKEPRMQSRVEDWISWLKVQSAYDVLARPLLFSIRRIRPRCRR